MVEERRLDHAATPSTRTQFSGPKRYRPSLKEGRIATQLQLEHVAVHDRKQGLEPENHKLEPDRIERIKNTKE